MKTIARLLSRLFPPLLAGTFGICAMLLFLRRADADPVVATSPPGFDWAFWLAIASAIGTALSFVLHRVALKTHNAKVEALAQDVDTLRGLVPTPAPQLTIAPAPRDKQAGFIRPRMMVALALACLPALAIWGGAQLTGCSTAPVQQLKSEGSAAVASTLDCAKKLGPGQLEAGLVTLAGDIAVAILQHGAIDWGALAAAAIADVTEVKACALAEYHAVTSKQASPTAEAALMSVNAPPVSPLAAAVAKVKAARGVTVIVTPAGGV